MEHWNGGRMKNGMMEQWNNGVMGKNKNESFSFGLTQHSNIPLFQYSNGLSNEEDRFSNYC